MDKYLIAGLMLALFASWLRATLRARRFYQAVLKHRAADGHERCWLNDGELYRAVLGKAGPPPTLPDKPEFMSACEEYYHLQRGEVPAAIPGGVAKLCEGPVDEVTDVKYNGLPVAFGREAVRRQRLEKGGRPIHITYDVPQRRSGAELQSEADLRAEFERERSAEKETPESGERPREGQVMFHTPQGPLHASPPCSTCRGARHLQNDATGEIKVCPDCNAGGRVDNSLRPGTRWA